MDRYGLGYVEEGTLREAHAGAANCALLQESREPCGTDVESWLRPEVFKALADESRLAVLARIAIAGRSMTVTEIQSCCGIHISGVSRHLRQLRSVGLVQADKDGREVRYRLQAADAVALLRGLADALEYCETHCCTEEK